MPGIFQRNPEELEVLTTPESVTELPHRPTDMLEQLMPLSWHRRVQISAPQFVARLCESPELNVLLDRVVSTVSLTGERKAKGIGCDAAGESRVAGLKPADDVG